MIGHATVPVWAPNANTVDLLIYSDETTITDTIAMQPTGDGWWRSPTPLPDGTLYMFRLDGSDPYPDPRVPRLPYTVHGPGQTWNPATYNWTHTSPDKEPLGGVFYELHIGTFSPEGTFDAAIPYLDKLTDIGIDTIELMPIVPSPGTRGWGYDGVSLYGVWEQYGGPDGLQRFVDAAHGKGLQVCIDVVLNHAGPEGNYIQQFGPYFAPKHKTPWGDGFNTDSEHCDVVRDYLIGIPLRLFRDFHVDSIRLDAVHALADDSDTHILAQLSQQTDALATQLNRPLRLIAESDLNDPTMITPRDQGGYGIHAQWDDDVHHAVHVAFTGEHHGYFEDFADTDAMRKTYEEVFYHNGTFSTFRNATWGKPVDPTIPRYKFVVFSANHDQVGNRALGDRPSDHITHATNAAQAAFIILSPYTPMLFMGEEWSATTAFQFFTDYHDPGLGKAVTKGRAREFAGHGWEKLYGTTNLDVPDPQNPTTYTNSKLNWDERTRGDHADMLTWYTKLITLRHQSPDINSGKQPRFVAHNKSHWYALSHHDTVIITNLSDNTVTIPIHDVAINDDEPIDDFRVVLGWKNEDAAHITDTDVRLAAHSTVVLRRNR